MPEYVVRVYYDLDFTFVIEADDERDAWDQADDLADEELRKIPNEMRGNVSYDFTDTLEVNESYDQEHMETLYSLDEDLDDE